MEISWDFMGFFMDFMVAKLVYNQEYSMVNSNKFDIPPQFTVDGITWVILGQAFG